MAPFPALQNFHSATSNQSRRRQRQMSSYNVQDEATRRHKRPISARKSEANRQNALRSTGPRTTRGKAKSRGNALKHGFFARDLFTYFAVQRENPLEFQDLVAR